MDANDAWQEICAQFAHAREEERLLQYFEVTPDSVPLGWRFQQDDLERAYFIEDVGAAYALAEWPAVTGHIIAYVKHRRTGKWEANPGSERPLHRLMVNKVAGLEVDNTRLRAELAAALAKLARVVEIVKDQCKACQICCGKSAYNWTCTTDACPFFEVLAAIEGGEVEA